MVSDRTNLLAKRTDVLQYKYVDSSRISDGEIRTHISKLSAPKLAAWFVDEVDEVVRQTTSADADEFKTDLLARISSDLTLEEDDRFARALLDHWCNTALDANGNRTLLPRAERRRRSKRMRDILLLEKNSGEVPNEGVSAYSENSSLQSQGGMTCDANGQLLMSAEKLAEILEVPVDEVIQAVEGNPHEFTTGFSPGVAPDGTIIPLKTIDARGE